MPNHPALQAFIDEEIQHLPVLGRTVVDEILRRLEGTTPPWVPKERAELANLTLALKKEQARVAQAFSDSVHSQVQPDENKLAAPIAFAATDLQLALTDPSEFSLSLVGENAVNVEVQISHCVTEIKAVAEFELREMTTFTSALCGEKQVDQNHNPFTAEVMAQAFWDSAVALSSEAELRNAYMRRGGPVLAAYLRRYYASTCGRLEDQGIQPAAYRTVIVPAGAKVDRSGWTMTDQALRHIAQGEAFPAASDQDTTAARGGAPFAPDSTMWSGDFAAPLNPRTAAVAPSETTPEVADLGGPFRPAVQAPPMGVAPTRQPTLPPITFPDEVAGGAGDPSATAKPAAAASPQYLNLLNRLFDIILADRRMPRDIKLALSRLQAPAMRLALQDSTLLNAHDHDLWRLLDRMAWWADLLPPHEDPARQTELDALDDIIDQVVTTETLSATVFAEALSRLKSRETSRFSVTLNRLQKVMQQLDRLAASEPQSNTSHAPLPLDTQQYETVPAGLLDVHTSPMSLQSAQTWLNTLLVGDHARLYVDNGWVHAQLAWISTRRDIYLWADCQSPKAWPIRQEAMSLLLNEGLALAHAPRSLVKAAARLVANQIAQARKA